MRYVIKFTKESDIKFIAHLDLMRTIHRVFRRAGLPVEYSKGFNPHMNVSMAQPLPVGVYSEGEYLDVVFTEEVEESLIQEKLNESSPQGIRFTKVIKVIEIRTENEKKLPQVAALLDGADYKITIPCSSTEHLEEDIKALIDKEQWVTLKKTKSGEKEVDIRPLVKEFKYSLRDNNLEIEALLACGSRENLSAELLKDYVKSKLRGVKEESFSTILRHDMYTSKGGKLVSIEDYYS